MSNPVAINLNICLLLQQAQFCGSASIEVFGEGGIDQSTEVVDNSVNNCVLEQIRRMKVPDRHNLVQSKIRSNRYLHIYHVFAADKGS
jgi:hypothetical protein